MMPLSPFSSFTLQHSPSAIHPRTIAHLSLPRSVRTGKGYIEFRRTRGEKRFQSVWRFEVGELDNESNFLFLDCQKRNHGQQTKRKEHHRIHTTSTHTFSNSS